MNTLQSTTAYGPTLPVLPTRTFRSWRDVLLTPAELARLRIEAECDALPAEPPADLVSVYRAAVYRLMAGDYSAWTKIHELRNQERNRQTGAR